MRFTHGTLGVCLLLMAPLTSFAGTKVGDFDLGANVSLTTDYVWRGVSQSDKHPAIQGGVTVNHATGLYVGAWGSTVDFDDNSEGTMELDLTAGFAYEFKDGPKLDLGLIHYDYPGAASRLEYDFEEVYLGASYKTHGVGLSAKGSYSDDFFGVAAKSPPSDKSAYYLEAGLTYDLPYDLVAAAHYGHTAGKHFETTVVNRPDNYDDYSLGVSREFFGFGLDLSFYGTDKAGRQLNLDNAHDRVVAKITKTF